jgi:hypothetical protein
MEYNIKKDIPDYAIDDCKSLQQCAECCGYRLPLALAYTIYHRWSEDVYCAGWIGNAFNCFTFVTLMNFIGDLFTKESGWDKPRYKGYTVIDDGSYPLEILNNSKDLYSWILKLDDDE